MGSPSQSPLKFFLNNDVLYSYGYTVSSAWYPKEISFTFMSPRSAFPTYTYFLYFWQVYLKAFWNSCLNVSKYLKVNDFKINSSTIPCLLNFSRPLTGSHYVVAQATSWRNIHDSFLCLRTINQSSWSPISSISSHLCLLNFISRTNAIVQQQILPLN